MQLGLDSKCNGSGFTRPLLEVNDVEPLTDRETRLVEEACSGSLREAHVRMSLIGFVGVCLAAALWIWSDVEGLVQGSVSRLQFQKTVGFCGLFMAFFLNQWASVRARFIANSAIRKLHQRQVQPEHGE